MLSSCSPFSNRVKFAESQLGSAVGVFADLENIDGMVYRVDLTSVDEQTYADANGVLFVLHATNAKELISTFFHQLPSAKLVRVTVHVTGAGKELSGDIPCIPINPELISTVARKLIRDLYGAH